MRTRIWLAATGMVLSGCVHGPQLKKLGFPTTPYGAYIAFQIGAAKYDGELIAVEDSGLVVTETRRQRVLLIPIGNLRRITIEGLGSHNLPLDERTLRRVRLVARHPYGLTPAIASALLELHRQSEFERLRQ